MTTATTPPATSSAEAVRRDRSTAYTALIGLTSLAILLQGLWAGIFLEHDGKRDDAGNWIDVHARGGEVALVLAIAATVVAFWRVRRRGDLWAGGLVLTVLLVLESYLGGLIRDDSRDALTAVHVPLGMAIMAAAAALTVRAFRRPKP